MKNVILSVMLDGKQVPFDALPKEFTEWSFGIIKRYRAAGGAARIKKYVRCVTCGSFQAWKGAMDSFQCAQCKRASSPLYVAENDGVRERDLPSDALVEHEYNILRVDVAETPATCEVCLGVLTCVRSGLAFALNRYESCGGGYGDGMYDRCVAHIAPYLFADESLETRARRRCFQYMYPCNRGWTIPTQEEFEEKLNNALPQWAYDILMVMPSAITEQCVQSYDPIPELIPTYRYLLLHNVCTYDLIVLMDKRAKEEVAKHAIDSIERLAAYIMKYAISDGSNVVYNYIDYAGGKSPLCVGNEALRYSVFKTQKLRDAAELVVSNIDNVKFEHLRAFADAAIRKEEKQ